MSPTCLPLAAISKWIGLRSSLTFSKLFSAYRDVMEIPLAPIFYALFDGRAGLYLSLSSAEVEAVELINTRLHEQVWASLDK